MRNEGTAQPRGIRGYARDLRPRGRTGLPRDRAGAGGQRRGMARSPGRLPAEAPGQAGSCWLPGRGRSSGSWTWGANASP